MSSNFYRDFYIDFKNDESNIISTASVGRIGSDPSWNSFNSVIPQGTREITIRVEPGALKHEMGSFRIE